MIGRIPRLIFEHPWGFGLIVFVSIVAMFAIGRRFAQAGDEPSGPGLGLMDGAIFALLGLLMAFTFSAAAARFDARRTMIVDEANAIGTARLRLDLLPTDVQPAANAAMDRYVANRLQTYDNMLDPAEIARELQQGQALQQELWGIAIAAGKRPDALPAVNVILLPALNQMFDISTTRMMAMKMHTPIAVYLVLWGAALVSALVAGHSLGRARGAVTVHVLAFSGLMAISLYVIIDFEYPRAGLIRVDSFDQVLTGEVLKP
jgi:hypothetical protein